MPNTAVITFGRFNPITVGHEKLVNKIKSYASSMNADPFVYLSHSHNSTNNPLAYDAKLAFARQAFGDVVVESDARTIMQAAHKLSDYDNLIVFVGSDRVDAFDTLLHKYNNIEYNFDTITVMSAGQRDDKLDTVAGMSGTKLRNYAINNDIKNFASGLPINLQADAELVMNTIRKGLNYE